MYAHAKIADSMIDHTTALRYLRDGTVKLNAKDYANAIVDFSVAITHDPKYTEAYLGRSECYAETDDLERALNDAESAIDLAPDDAAGYGLRAQFCLGLNRYDDAVADTNRAVELDAEHRYSIIAQAALAERDQRYDDVIVVTTPLIDQDDNTPQLHEARALRGRAYAELKQYGNAAADFQHLLDVGQHVWAAHHWLYHIAINKDDDEMARQHLDAALAQDRPAHTSEFMFRGTAHYYNKDYSAALADFDEAIKRNPHPRSSYYWRGLTHMHLQQYEPALADIETAIQLGLNHEHVRQTQISLLNDQKRYEDALNTVNDWLETDPENRAKALVVRSIVLAHLQRYYEANRDLEEAVSLAPDDPHVLATRAMSYVSIGDHKRAVAALTRAIVAAPALHFLRLHRGRTYLEAGMYNEAITDLTEYLEKKPDSSEALRERGRAYQKMGNQEKALDDFNQAIALDPDNQSLLAWRVDALWRLRRYAEAITDSRRRIELSPDSDNAYYYLARIYCDTEDHDAAMTAINKVIDLNPNDNRYYELRDQIRNNRRWRNFRSRFLPFLEANA